MYVYKYKNKPQLSEERFGLEAWEGYRFHFKPPIFLIQLSIHICCKFQRTVPPPLQQGFQQNPPNQIEIWILSRLLPCLWFRDLICKWRICNPFPGRFLVSSTSSIRMVVLLHIFSMGVVSSMLLHIARVDFLSCDVPKQNFCRLVLDKKRDVSGFIPNIQLQLRKEVSAD